MLSKRYQKQRASSVKPLDEAVFALQNTFFLRKKMSFIKQCLSNSYMFCLTKR